MARRDIIIIPDPVLRKTAQLIERFDGELKKLSEDMFQTMYEAPGIGLAAPQINIPIRMFVIDTALRNEPDPDAPTLDGGDEPPQLRTTTPNPKVFINPEIVSSSDERNVYEEGCLSIPDYFAEIERPANIVMSYSDINGKRLEETFTGIDATVIQHEYDHLDGVLFIDYLSKLKRDRVIKKFAKLKKGAQPKL